MGSTRAPRNIIRGQLYQLLGSITRVLVCSYLAAGRANRGDDGTNGEANPPSAQPGTIGGNDSRRSAPPLDCSAWKEADGRGIARPGIAIFVRLISRPYQ